MASVPGLAVGPARHSVTVWVHSSRGTLQSESVHSPDRGVQRVLYVCSFPCTAGRYVHYLSISTCPHFWFCPKYVDLFQSLALLIAQNPHKRRLSSLLESTSSLHAHLDPHTEHLLEVQNQPHPRTTESESAF